jgi:Raf kinase inhibitor-like YbhB/YbcL family protein
MKLTSSEFASGAKLDAKYTVEGHDISPPLSWSDAPLNTKSFALICDDPDAPSPQRPAAQPWVHWVMFNIPADRAELPAGIGQTLQPDEVPGARQGKNSWPSNNHGYRGPAPPPGSGQHRYFFKLHALDTILELPEGATKQQLLKAMSGHVLAEAELIGTYER